MSHNQKRSRLILASLLVVLVGAICYWQGPGSRLATQEIERYLQLMDEGLPMPGVEKAEFLSRLRTWGAADDGKPVHMLNLIRFHDRMLPVPGHPDFAGTAQQANAHYEKVILPLLAARGVYPVFASTPQELETDTGTVTNLLGYEDSLEGWDRILLVRYPSRRAFLDLASDPTYLTIVPFKLAAIDLGFIPLTKHYLVPDLRWIAVLSGFAVFLGFVTLQNSKPND